MNSKKTKYQKFVMKQINRSQINFAKYNPNEMGEDARKRVKRKIKNKDVGLIEAVVWNKQTGNLVGGHHRISIIDELEKNTDYDIDVCVVDLDEKTEKEMNVFLNNPSVQGEYNLSQLANFKLNEDLDFKDMGFNDSDVDFMFGGDSDFSKLFDDTIDIAETKEKIKEIKESRAGMKDKHKEKNEADFFFVVVCDSDEQKRKLVKMLNTPAHEKYVNAEYLEKLLNKGK